MTNVTDLIAEAQQHKRQMYRHKRALRETMVQIRELCDKYGWDFQHVVKGVDDSRGRPSDQTDP